MSHPHRPRWTTERRTGAPTEKQNYRRPDGDEDDDDSDDEMPGAYAITSNVQRRPSPPLEELETQHSHINLQDETQQVSRMPSVFHDEPGDSLQEGAPIQSLEPAERAGDEESVDKPHAVSRFMSSEEVRIDNQSHEFQWCMSKWCIMICAVCLVAAACSAIFAAVVLFAGDDEAAEAADDVGTGLHHGQDTDLRDPYVQCMSQSEVTLISDGVQEAYKSLKALAPLQPFLPRDMDITSCDVPANLALLWLALEVNNGYEYNPEGHVNRFVLLELFASMGGPGWKEKAGWLTHTPECSWYGIRCDMNKQTIKFIKLSGNNLEGTLESSLGLLTGLKKLNLSYNSVSGSIPPSVWNLRELEDLFLGGNPLVGNLPSSLADHAPSLKRLSLPQTEISGELPLLTRMSHLVEFDLSQTLMRGSFPTVGLDHLTSLEVLKLNSLTGMTGTLPSSIALMTNLRELHLSVTSLSGTLPEAVGEISSVEKLEIGSSGLSGTIPTSLGYLTNLTHLELRDNLQLGGTIPSELGSCSRLRVVGLTHTRIAGTLPLGLVNLSNLEDFYISCTDITEPFPNGICGHRTNIYTDLTELHESSECECCMPPTGGCDMKGVDGPVLQNAEDTQNLHA